MNRANRKDLFFMEVGEAMFMNNTRSFIDMETLGVEIHSEEDYFIDNGLEDTAEEEIQNPGKFFPVEQEHASTAFRVMENFAETVNDYRLKSRLLQALEKRKPFSNFRYVIDNTAMRDAWFTFRNAAYAAIAKEWIEVNAPQKLKEKIKQLI